MAGRSAVRRLCRAGRRKHDEPAQHDGGGAIADSARRSEAVDRQFLHAWKLAFAMPQSGRPVEFESPLPTDLREALEELRAEV